MKPRDHALRELDTRRLPHWPSDILKKSQSFPADPRDLALAENIVEGVIKNLLLLQHLIQHYSGRNLKSSDPIVQKILAIALYQLRFLDRIPPSAAVDEAVEQTRRFGQSRASGFVNAVLRKATRDPSPPLPSRDNPAQYAHLALSHPPELFEKLSALFDPQTALRFCEHNQAEPPTIVRLFAGVDPKMLATQGVTVTPHEQSPMYVVQGAKRSLFADWAACAIAQVQDPTAAAVVQRLPPQPGQIILDRCCGLGTKTIQLQEAIGSSGKVIAVDPAETRCRALVTLLQQRAIPNVEVYCTAWLKDVPEATQKHFDRALLDVPCSNSGVLARRPEARYSQNPRSIQSLANLQDEILADTAPFIKPQSLLVYSTCSIWPEENQQRIDAFLQKNPQFELLDSQLTLPSFQESAIHYHDGGFVAVLRRN